MTHEESNLRMKQHIAAALKRSMAKKPLSKITVTEIITDCNINRKTFYYHFTDLHALLKWILEEEVIHVVTRYDLFTAYEEAILLVLNYVEEHAAMLNNAFDSIGREEMKHLFHADFQEIVEKIINGAQERHNVRVSEEYKAFLCEFYTEAVSGLLLSMLKGRAHADKRKIIDYFYLTVRSSVIAALETADGHDGKRVVCR